MALNKNAKKWVRALRSNAFVQGKDALAKDGKFCCLGVACVLAVADGVIPAAQKDDIMGRLEFSGEGNYLPAEVVKYLGLADRRGQFRDSFRLSSSLANLNDDGEKFAEIADIIESEPEGLFRKVAKPRRKTKAKTRKRTK